MKTDIVRIGAKRLAIFVACVASIPIWPYIAVAFWKVASVDFLFFAPQIAFPYHGIFTSDLNIAGSHVRTFTPTVATWLTIGQWILVAVLFAAATIRVRRTGYLILLSLVTIALVIFATHPVINLCGKTLFLDGL